MKIISKISSTVNSLFGIAQYDSTLYAVSPAVLSYVTEKLNPGKTLVLFSGGNRFDLDATYLEPKMFSCLDINWKPNTIFVDPARQDLILYSIKKINPDNLLILNSGVFMNYRSWQEIKHELEQYQQCAGRVIATLPLTRFDFNRLKYTNQQIAEHLNGTVIDSTVVVCQ